jgi:hypothetical protein
MILVALAGASLIAYDRWALRPPPVDAGGDDAPGEDAPGE